MPKDILIVFELEDENKCTGLYRKLSEEVEAALYYLLVAGILKIKKYYSVSENCYNSVKTHQPEEMSTLSKFTNLKEFNNSYSLIYSSLALHNCKYKIELYFRSYEKDIIKNKINLRQFL